MRYFRCGWGYRCFMKHYSPEFNVTKNNKKGIFYGRDLLIQHGNLHIFTRILGNFGVDFKMVPIILAMGHFHNLCNIPSSNTSRNFISDIFNMRCKVNTTALLMISISSLGEGGRLRQRWDRAMAPTNDQL